MINYSTAENIFIILYYYYIFIIIIIIILLLLYYYYYISASTDLGCMDSNAAVILVMSAVFSHVA